MHRIHRMFLFCHLSTGIVFADAIHVGLQTQVYSHSQLPNTNELPHNKLVIDASMATVRTGPNSVDYYLSADYGFRKFSGTPERPFETTVFEKSRSEAWPSSWAGNAGISNSGNLMPFIMNVYKISSTELLGFVHLEIGNAADSVAQCAPCTGSPVPCVQRVGRCDLIDTQDVSQYLPAPNYEYRIGLAISDDGGGTWKYLHHIIQNGSGINIDKSVAANLGGVPYLVVGEYFYVYFNQTDATHSWKGISVARAKVSDVVSAAQNLCTSSCPEWTKWDGTGFSRSYDFIVTSTGQQSMNIIPQHPSFPRTNGGYNYDIHQDAIYCAGLGKYFMTVGVQDNPGYVAGLLLYKSKDGVQWEDPIVLASPDTSWRQPYVTFVSTSPHSEDMHSAGNAFNILYPYVPAGTDKEWFRQDLLMRKITVNPQLPAINGLLLR